MGVGLACCEVADEWTCQPLAVLCAVWCGTILWLGLGLKVIPLVFVLVVRREQEQRPSCD